MKTPLGAGILVSGQGQRSNLRQPWRARRAPRPNGVARPLAVCPRVGSHVSDGVPWQTRPTRHKSTCAAFAASCPGDCGMFQFSMQRCSHANDRPSPDSFNRRTRTALPSRVQLVCEPECLRAHRRPSKSLPCKRCFLLARTRRCSSSRQPS